MKLRITIDMNNAALESTEGEGIARILRFVAIDARLGHLPTVSRKLIDSKGNAVGTLEVEK